LRDASSVKAVVLRIDSPGGSALASDLLWRELMLLKAKKPLIVSVGNLAASGGYYMACAGHRIVASRTSIVGSIGVVGGKLVLGSALTSYGVDAVTISPAKTENARERAAYLSALTPWDEGTRQRVSDQMEEIYELFLRRVAEGRGLGVDAVRRVAEGRIWSGQAGLELGLVDEIGGLDRAIELARERAGLPSNVNVEVDRGRDSWLDLLLLDEGADEEDVRAALGRIEALRPDFFALVPDRVRAHVATLAPLLAGENVLAASPFALDVE
jgi:protease-4